MNEPVRNARKDSNKRLHVLIADNDLDTCELVRETVEEIDDMHATICLSAEQVELLPKSSTFDICVFDVRFAEAKYQAARLLDLASARWPEAILCILSNYLGDLTSRDK